MMACCRLECCTTSGLNVEGWHLCCTLFIQCTQARNCQQSNAYFECISLESISCGFGSLVPGCCLLMLLLSEWEICGSCVKHFCWNNVANGWKFVKFTKLKICENLALCDTLFCARRNFFDTCRWLMASVWLLQIYSQLEVFSEDRPHAIWNCTTIVTNEG